MIYAVWILGVSMVIALLSVAGWMRQLCIIQASIAHTAKESHNLDLKRAVFVPYETNRRKH